MHRSFLLQPSAFNVVDKSGDRVQTMFAQIAPHYDRMNHLLSMNIDKLWRSKTVRLLRPFANEAVLDVCTGTGDLAIAFATKTQCPKIVEPTFVLLCWILLAANN